jgi:hypothetical protein
MQHRHVTAGSSTRTHIVFAILRVTWPPRAALHAKEAQLLELPKPRRAGEQAALERQAAREGPLQLRHRAKDRADARGHARADLAPLAARDRLAQLAARERGGELIVVGQVGGYDSSQLHGQIEKAERVNVTELVCSQAGRHQI